MSIRKKEPGLIVVISSPSGTGKTTICHRLIRKSKDYVFSVSATTRPPRKNEKNGRDYHFLTDRQFDRRLKNGEFAEWARVFGYRYGTLRSSIDNALKAAKVLLCDVDVQGGMSIKKSFNNAVNIFIIPPSLTELRRRLFKRRTESPAQKKVRLKTALEELKFWNLYDYVVVNDELKTAVQEVDMIVAAEKRRAGRLMDNKCWSRAQRKLLGLRGTRK
jgi:guanylate kinase